MPYSGLPFDAIVYEGFLPEGSAPLSGVGPKSNVRDFNDNLGRLGCGEPAVFITNRCGDGVTCILTESVTSVTWSRVLDNVSEAEVVVSIGGDTASTCCACLSDTEPWCQELHIWRDGEEVWVGPITQVEYGYNEVIVRAKDSLAWLNVRIPEGNIDYTSAGLGAADLTTIAQNILAVAFAEDPCCGLTCEIDSVVITPIGTTTNRFIPGNSDNALDQILDLADEGLNITTVGRIIYLSGDSPALQPLILLNDEHIMGEIKLLKDGELQGNRYFIHFDNDAGIPAISDPVDMFCYSVIERIRDGGVPNFATAKALANAYVTASSIAPRILEIPDGSQLSPDTPWTLDQMVCGARVDVAITKLCLNVTQSFILTAVNVSYGADSGEQINITLVPVNNLSS